MTGRSLAEVEPIVRNRICSVCSERIGNEACGLEKPSGCALFQLFPQVAQAIAPVKSEDINDHIGAIRGQVCAVCSDQPPGGFREARQQARCALDAYLLLVVDAIEEATGKVFDRSMPGFSGQAEIRTRPEIRL